MLAVLGALALREMRRTDDIEPGGRRRKRRGRAVLRRNWHEGARRDPFAYTEPSPGRYPWQWYWDSCFAAISGAVSIPPARLSWRPVGAQRPDGFIGHTIFWGQPVPLRRLAFYNVASRSSIRPRRSSRRCWPGRGGSPSATRQRCRGSSRTTTGWPNRDLDGDGLLWIIQPDESGLDASPQFEPVSGRRANGRPGFPLLVGATAGSASTRSGSRGGGRVCADAGQHDVHALLLALGRPSTTPALIERLYDERTGCSRRGAPRGAPARRSPGRRWPRSPCPTCPK